MECYVFKPNCLAGLCFECAEPGLHVIDSTALYCEWPCPVHRIDDAPLSGPVNTIAGEQVDLFEAGL